MQGKKILIGITGSIAAYKTPLLIRQFIGNGAEVRTVATSSAFDFVTGMTLSTLSRNPVCADFINDRTGVWNNHVELGLWADVMVIAPATANTIGKMANGLCDNILLASYLSARCPIVVAPAMDLDMLQHPSVQKNLDTLRSFGHHLIDPTVGELASGLVGNGRMAEPNEIYTFVSKLLNA